jgi:hypothetical protein
MEMDYYIVDPRIHVAQPVQVQVQTQHQHWNQLIDRYPRCKRCLGNFVPFVIVFLILAIVLAALSLTVIIQYHDFEAYNETSCCCTHNIERWCRRRDDSCEATAEATSVAGQTVKLKFPSYQLFRGSLSGYNQWAQHINNATFRCYVQSSARTTVGVTSYKIDMHGWYAMASLAAVCLVIVIVYFPLKYILYAC